MYRLRQDRLRHVEIDGGCIHGGRRSAAPDSTRGGAGEGALGPARGFLEEGEAPEEGARREVREELGVELGALDLLLVDLNDGGEQPVVDIMYKCSEIHGAPRPLEVMDIGWFSPDSFPEDLAFDATRRLLPRARAGASRRSPRRKPPAPMPPAAATRPGSAVAAASPRVLVTTLASALADFVDHTQAAAARGP